MPFENSTALRTFCPLIACVYTQEKGLETKTILKLSMESIGRYFVLWCRVENLPQSERTKSPKTIPMSKKATCCDWTTSFKVRPLIAVIALIHVGMVLCGRAAKIEDGIVMRSD